MDINDYRRKIEQSVAKVQAGKAKASSRTRAAAAPGRALSAQKKKAKQKKKSSPKVRAEELGRATDAQGPDAVPQAALDRLADPKESPVVRLAAIKLLQQQQIISSVA